MAKQIAMDILPPCAKENHIDESKLAQFFSETHVFEPTRDNKCFFKCVYNKLGYIDDNGTLIKEKLLEDVKKEMPDKLKPFEDCLNKGDIVKNDPCDTAYAIHECLAKSV